LLADDSVRLKVWDSSHVETFLFDRKESLSNMSNAVSKPSWWLSLIGLALTLSSLAHADERFELLDAQPPSGLGCFVNLQSVRPIWFKEDSTSFLYDDELWRASRSLLVIWEEDRGYLIVEGHVDHHEADIGDGQDLSRRRAELVAKALEELGIPREYIIPVGRADSRYHTSYDPGSRIAPINRRVQIIPTHRGRKCNQHFLIRYAIFFSQNCQGRQADDPIMRQRCEQVIEGIPMEHRELMRTGKVGPNR
jgi:hypothetical protein